MENTLGRYDLLHCRSGELPFSEQSFLRVALVHVLETGREKELSEACRVLAPGGELLLLGLNANGLRCRLDKAAAEFPRFGLTMIQQRLLDLGMTVDARFGLGCLGINRLDLPSDGVGPFLSTFADLIVVRARHNQGPPLSPLRLSEFQPEFTPSA
jgi:SAM-dependent methyltransferase